eukprot:gb/GEZN01009642.1/.p1 GENE.gb/GEZN01009642.1/~~gb/GEZN01009642.1/.p1  ORF type:complete len:388 (+),score=25.53 gb/GEZN01009642.1/:88-1164(+)
MCSSIHVQTVQKEDKANASNLDYGGPNICDVLFVVFCATMYALHGILVELSAHPLSGKTTYLFSGVVLISEMLKLVVSLGLGLASGTSRKQWCPGWKEFSYFLAPAAIYAINNNLAFHLLRYMDAGTFQLLSNFKILTTAVLYQGVFRTRLDNMQKCSLLLLLLGSCAAAIRTSNSRAEQRVFIMPMGVVGMLVYCVLSAFAGVLSEFLLKGKNVECGSVDRKSIHARNVHNYIGGLLFSTPMWLVETHSYTLLDGYNGWTYLVVLNQAFVGLALSAVMAFRSSISKLFIIGVSVIIAELLELSLFHRFPNQTFSVAAALIVLGLLLNNHTPCRTALVGALMILSFFSALSEFPERGM